MLEDLPQGWQQHASRADSALSALAMFLYCEEEYGHSSSGAVAGQEEEPCEWGCKSGHAKEEPLVPAGSVCSLKTGLKLA